jgi:metal-sulfur cluster biosynthetic enzyme
MPSKEQVLEALKDVYDPEIPINVVDLGLVYGVEIDEGNVDIRMTLTFAGCGMGPYIANNARERLLELDDVEDVNVEMVFDPPWSQEMMSEETKAEMGID